jgi:hypothetical protein
MGAKDSVSVNRERLRQMLTGGDRRSLARVDEVVALVLTRRPLVSDLASLTTDEGDWVVSARALDALEKVAHRRPQWVRPYRQVFLQLSTSEHWEIRLQVVRAIPLLHWTPRELKQALDVVRANLMSTRPFVRAWALDSLAVLTANSASLSVDLEYQLDQAEQSDSKAVRARARHIRARLGDQQR